MKKPGAFESKLPDATRNLAVPPHRVGSLSEKELARLNQRAPKVLVVDDRPETLDLLRDLLSSRGYEIITAAEAKQAEEMVHSQKPDLVLLDVVMPGKSGYELCRELNEDPFTRLIPVVLIIGLSEREDRVRGIE